MMAFSAVGYVLAVTTSICAALLTPGSTNGILYNPQPSDITIDTCGENQFRCRNGDCIQSELLCDGRADCSDQSDETQAECAKPELTCGTYAFRCTYGACVNGDAACNGIKDCVDNSDEAPSKCPTIFVANRAGGCGPDDYRCRDGQCISSTSLCDGTVDCSDGSDETYENCGSFDCGSLVFRCNYGACINGDLTCNNVSNCADGSDEGAFLCGRPTTVSANPLSCMVPPQPKNGYWRLNSSLCEAGGKVNCESPQGHALEPGSLLVYGCNDRFKISGNPEVYCGLGRGTWSSIPVCIPITCSVLDHVSTLPSCFTSWDEYTDCFLPVPPETRATVLCRPGYRRDTSSPGSEHVLCNRNGKWYPEPIKCVPDCGKAIVPVRPTSVGGTVANIGHFPWHATIYEQTNTSEGLKKEFRCGATIIQDNLVMTAAHCVYDEVTKTPTDPNRLFIMTGNTFRNFDSPLHDNRTVKSQSVKNVHMLCRYVGMDGSYAGDIALLELKRPFPISDTLLPACLDFVGSHADLLAEGSIGKVAGFGGTATGPSSGILQTLTLPYVPEHKCKIANQSGESPGHYGVDKFCAGYNNGSAVCQGDSGGGLVFETFGQWYVLGIVSLSLGYDSRSQEPSCDKYSYSLYTRVSHYRGWIWRKMFDLKRNNYSSDAAPCDSSDPSL